MLTYEQFKENLLADAQKLHDGKVCLSVNDDGEEHIMFTSKVRSVLEVKYDVDGAVGAALHPCYKEYTNNAEKGKNIYDTLLREMTSWARNAIQDGKHIQVVESLTMPDGAALVAEMKQKLPLFANVPDALAEQFNLKSSVSSLCAEIIDVFDAAEASGILCAFKVLDKTGLVCAVTHLDWHEKGEIYDRIREYREKRIEWLKTIEPDKCHPNANIMIMSPDRKPNRTERRKRKKYGN